MLQSVVSFLFVWFSFFFFWMTRKIVCIKSISPLSCLIPSLVCTEKYVYTIHMNRYRFSFSSKIRKHNLRKPKVFVCTHTHTSHKSFSYFLDVWFVLKMCRQDECLWDSLLALLYLYHLRVCKCIDCVCLAKCVTIIVVIIT